MIDISKLCEEDLQFYNDFKQIFSNGDESCFIRDGIDYSVDYKDGKFGCLKIKSAVKIIISTRPKIFSTRFQMTKKTFCKN